MNSYIIMDTDILFFKIGGLCYIQPVGYETRIGWVYILHPCLCIQTI
jgi:hypothetical protein